MKLAELIDPFGLAAHVDVERLYANFEKDLRNGNVVTPFTPRKTKGRAPVMVAGGSCNQQGGLGGELMEYARQCMPWGAPAPEHCIDTSGRIRPEKVCGAIMPYRSSVPLSSAGNAYTLRALSWCQPLFWVDSSHTDIDISDLTFQRKPVWKTQNVLVNPLAVFGASDAQRFVPGLPAFGSNDGDGLVFSLDNANAAAQDFAGIFIGVATP